MRSCCAERREAETCHGFCRNRPREAKPATVFFKKRKKLRIPWTESSEIAENCKFRGQNHQKTEKTGFPHPGESQNHSKTVFRGTPTSGNWQKLRFGAPRRAEISENCISATAER